MALRSYGQRAEGKALVPDETEQQAISRIRELDAAGNSLRQICEALTAEGIAPERGARWYPATVSRVLARPSA